VDWLSDVFDLVAIACLAVSISHIRHASTINEGLPRTLLNSFFLALILTSMFSIYRRYNEVPGIPILGNDYVMDFMQYITPLLFLLFMNSLSQSRTISDLERKGTQLEEREKLMEIQQSALLKLSRFSGDARASIRQSTEIAAQALKIHRVSIWLFNESGSKIVCQDLYERDTDTHSCGIELEAKKYPRYIAALQSGRIIDAEDVHEDRRTNESSNTYLRDHGIRSMMDTAISISGKVIGVLSCESRTDQRSWTIDEKNFARAVADIVSLHLEVEENKRISEELRREKDTVKYYFNAIDALVVGVDTEGKINLINRKACEVLGYSEEEIMHKPWLTNFVPDYAQEMIRDRFRRFISGELAIPDYLEDPVINRDGDIRTIRWKAGFQYDAVGNISGGLTVGEDITDSKAEAEEKSKLEKQLQQMQKMDTIGRLTGGIAHDFNNMLASIMGYTEMAQMQARGKDLPELASNLASIYSVGQRAAELVSQLMVYTRTNEVEMRASNINDIVRESLAILQSTIPSSIEMECKLANDLPLIRGNSVQLQQVLMNLALNARDALECKSPRISIATNLCQVRDIECQSCFEHVDGDFICLTISDNGSGIDPALQKDVFTPFMTTKESGKGTGMGLSMVHGIVHLHGGHLSLQSTPGEGTTIRLFLPLPGADLEESDQKLLEEAPLAAILGQGYRGKRVLLVDDEAEVARLISEFLTLKGLDVSLHTDSEAALTEFEANPESFSAIVTDLTMPKVSGLELIERVRRRNKDIPVVICSGNNDLLSQERIDRLGISSIYQKPVSFRKLVDDVANMIHQQRKGQAAPLTGTTTDSGFANI
jgi:PAS domain S-box-containing protein